MRVAGLAECDGGSNESAVTATSCDRNAGISLEPACGRMVSFLSAGSLKALRALCNKDLVARGLTSPGMWWEEGDLLCGPPHAFAPPESHYTPLPVGGDQAVPERILLRREHGRPHQPQHDRVECLRVGRQWSGAQSRQPIRHRWWCNVTRPRLRSCSGS